MAKSKMMDIQYLDNTYERFYFIPYPDCLYFDNMEDDINVIPVSNGSFVNIEWIGDGCPDE